MPIDRNSKAFKKKQNKKKSSSRTKRRRLLKLQRDSLKESENIIEELS